MPYQRSSLECGGRLCDQGQNPVSPVAAYPAEHCTSFAGPAYRLRRLVRAAWMPAQSVRPGSKSLCPRRNYPGRNGDDGPVPFGKAAELWAGSQSAGAPRRSSLAHFLVSRLSCQQRTLCSATFLVFLPASTWTWVIPSNLVRNGCLYRMQHSLQIRDVLRLVRFKANDVVPSMFRTLIRDISCLFIGMHAGNNWAFRCSQFGHCLPLSLCLRCRWRGAGTAGGARQPLVAVVAVQA